VTVTNVPVTVLRAPSQLPGSPAELREELQDLVDELDEQEQPE
jgi:hypothetical protein